MFVRRVEDFAGSAKEMKLTDGSKMLRSARILTKEDGCGFSISDVVIKGGWSIVLYYKNHMEINFVADGRVKVEDLTQNQSWELTQGMIYVVGPKDRHRLSAEGDAHIVSIFVPPITGAERHDADGAFPPTGDIPAAWREERDRTMFVMGLDDAKKVALGGGRTTAYRYLNRDDGCGVTLSTPRASAGGEATLWYKNHVEANYILEGEGAVEDLTTGEKWELKPGTLYVVGPKDRHRVRTKTPTYLMSIFNPPLVGNETHDAEGSYPPSGEIPPAWRT